MSLPGITLEQDHKEDCIDVLDSVCRTLRDGDFAGSASAAQEADAPLWFFYTLQELESEIGSREIWRRYGEAMKSILAAYRRGIGGRVALHGNGLVWASDEHVALTWMNSYADGRPVTPRNGYQVEINALWYNAVSYALSLAEEAGDKAFAAEWKEAPAQTKASFLEKFWLPEEGYLADFVNDAETNRFIRPNMVVACGLNYTMLDEEQLISVLRIVRQYLLTPKGLRSLSPQNPLYNGSYAGDDRMRSHAAMNGTVWVWPLPFYVKARYALTGADYTPEVERFLADFDEDIQCHGIGSISKMYDADPPFAPKSAISYAWSVGAVLELYRLMERFDPAWRKKREKAAPKTGSRRAAGAAKPRTATEAAAAPADSARKGAADEEAKPAKRPKAPAKGNGRHKTERKTVKK